MNIYQLHICNMLEQTHIESEIYFQFLSYVLRIKTYSAGFRFWL